MSNSIYELLFRRRRIPVVLLILVSSSAGFAQIATGGSFSLQQAVIAGGGRSNGAGPGFTMEGTMGQPAAGGARVGGAFEVRNGFWNPLFGPNAAGAEVGGRVSRADGAGIRNVIVTLSGGTLSSPRTTRTGSFGFFTFEDVPAGQTYVVSVRSKQYGFGESSQVITVSDSISSIVFVASWQN